MRTDWNKVADWYGDYLQHSNTYQRAVIFPGVKRLLQSKAHQHYLDVACGEGSFAEYLAKETQVHVTGFDAAPRLIQQAERRRRGPLAKTLHFFVANAEHFHRQVHTTFSGASCILALQNIERYEAVLQEVARILTTGSPFVMVINHPAFRLPRQSGWGWDEQRKLQYRRVDSYLTPYRVNIQMHPGQRTLGQRETISFHRPLQSYCKALSQTGFVITDIEEWISHRQSRPGARAKAENRARQEIPLFLALKAVRI